MEYYKLNNNNYIYEKNVESISLLLGKDFIDIFLITNDGQLHYLDSVDSLDEITESIIKRAITI